MKTSSASLQSRAPRGQQGIALVIVLSMLVIISGLLVAFMSTALNERSVSQMNSDNVAARQIADSTVNILMAQIRDATASTNEETTWASQPGAIRTFSSKLTTKLTTADQGWGWTFSGGRDEVFRLYSADDMRVSADLYESQLKDEVKVIENWNRFSPTPGYVDLNKPVFTTPDDPKAKYVIPHYPIIDPRAKFSSKGNTANSNAADGIVQGFDVKTDGLIDDTLRLQGGAGVPYLPMPVKWVYIFKDGSIGPASLGTSANPIVGRTAYWVDDESCKLNINTAAEGTFWDTPTVSIYKEAGGIPDGSTKKVDTSPGLLNLAVGQPTRGEYQRYPGHPATTSLSPALGWIWGINGSTATYPQSTVFTNFKESIAKLTPFLPAADPSKITTSMAGSFNAEPNNDLTKPLSTLVARKALYNSVDGLLTTSNTFNNANPELADIFAQQKFTPADAADALEKSRFFLTAASRAPEVNLYGRPRVTIWPVNDDVKRRTPYDDLFAFASTLGSAVESGQSKRFYLTRQDARKAKTDPSIPRNAQMMEYLTWLTDRNVPGFGGSFKDKYNFSEGNYTERDQILAEIFDYCRCINMVDTGTSRSTTGFLPYTPFYGGASTLTDTSRSYDWSGQVTPGRYKSGLHQGLGRFVTVDQAALVFYRVDATHMRAIFLFQLVSPMAGFPAIRDTKWTTVRAVQPATITIAGGTATPFNMCAIGSDPKTLINIPNIASHDYLDGRGYLPVLGAGAALCYYPEHTTYPDPNLMLSKPGSPPPPGFNSSATRIVKQFDNKQGASAGYIRGQTVQFYPYVSDPFVIGPAGTFDLSELKLDLSIYAGTATGDPFGETEPVQTIHLKFPAILKAPLPTTASTDFKLRFNSIGSRDSNRSYLTLGDTIRCIEYVGGGQDGSALTGNQAGDYRLGMTRAEVPESYYQPRGGLAIYNSSIQSNHGIHDAHGDGPYFKDANGNESGLQGYYPDRGNPGAASRFAAGSALHTSKWPVLPLSVQGVKRFDNGPGDWDRGVSKQMDGAMGNKVDEGNVFFDYADSANLRPPYYRGRGIEETGQSFFSPNRQLSSPVMFGGLPSGALAGKPWQTLLFRPDREALPAPGHPGAKIPPDHLLLDLFSLPVVEPWAISEPFSTAGKVNLNYVIAPFGYAKGNGGNNPGTGTSTPRSYVRRDTAVRGVLKAVKVMAVPTGIAQSGHDENNTIDKTLQTRFDIDLDRTINQMEIRLKDTRRGLFRSASEICDVDLYPGSTGGNTTPPGVSNWGQFWDTQFAQTGDNMRERPYSHIYPRVTTKSNVFTIHMRCQAIRKSPKSQANVFDEKKDSVVGEYRGSTIIERYIDPNDEALRTYDEQKSRVDPYYRFRVVATKHFAP